MNKEKSDQSMQATISFNEIETIMKLALTAPSGDNAQPWRFNWNDASLAIFYDESLGNHTLNNNLHAIWLALGSLLEAISISASGCKLKVQESLDLVNWKSRPVAVLNFSRQEVQIDPLISEIPKRHTYRWPMTQDRLSKTLIDQLHEEASSFKSCKLSLHEGPPLKIFDFLKFCDEYMWQNLKVAQDFLSWVRMSAEEMKTRSDGMPWQSIGIQKFDLIPFKVFRRLPFLIHWLWHFGVRKKVNQTTLKLMSSNAGTYCVGIKDPSAHSIIEAGKLTYRLWLLLNSNGFAVQPVSIPSLTAFDVVTGNPPPGTTDSDIARFKAGYQELRAYFNFSESHMPLWMFRAGRPAEKIAIAAAPRIKIQDRLQSN